MSKFTVSYYILKNNWLKLWRIWRCDRFKLSYNENSIEKTDSNIIMIIKSVIRSA